MSDVNEDIDQLTQTCNELNSIRMEMASKLRGATNSIKLDNIQEMRSADRESIMGVFTTLDSVLKSVESSKINNIKVKLAKTSSDSNESLTEAAVEMLKLVKIRKDVIPVVGEISQTLVEADDILEKRLADEGINNFSNEELENVTDDET